jgi:FrmR/RcnR family transcriptional regulator, repressor of rcnA expression
MLRIAIAMSHTIRDKEKLIARVRRLKGQIEGIERALDAEKPCGEILRQLASARGAMSGLTAEVMENHLREHVLLPETDADRQQGGKELIEVIRAYLK